mgnify:CR=1 FL=1|jgi:hypothetical protein|tara:strand:+ start:61 stop:522 length:462 start_codon:yes stop_codon:yes gene_type:complete
MNTEVKYLKEIMEKAQKHIIDNEDNVETFDETFAVKLTDALDDLRINNYYLMEKEYKFFKKVLRAMNSMRKRVKAGFTESFAFFLNFLLRNPIDLFKCVVFFKRDCEIIIGDYWQVKQNLSNYEELEERVLNLVDLLDKMSKIKQQYLRVKQK